MQVTDKLAAAAKKAGVTTNILNRATGLSRSTFSYWFRNSSTKRSPRVSRIPYVTKLTTVIEAAVAAGELPAASPKIAAEVIARRMNATQ